MRLHRLTLRDVKGVRECTVDLPDRGVVVIEGPNEIGKSTLLEAFDMLLSSKATSRAATVRALQPVDRDVAPFVEAELTIGDTRLRYAKQWLRQPSTTLHVLGPRPDQLTGDAAQQRMDGLVAQHLDRTLWDALRLTQAGDGTVAPLVSSAVLTQALDAAAGARQHAEGADALLGQVLTEYSLYFTATGRPTGNYRAAINRCTEAQQAVADAHRRVEEATSLLHRQQAAQEQVATARLAAAAAQEALAEAERAGAQADAVAAAHEAATQQLSSAEQLHRAALRASQQRQAMVEDVAAVAAGLHQVELARSADLEAAEGLREALLEAEEDVSRAADAVERADEELEAARADCDHLADARELAAAEATLGRTTELVERVQLAQDAQPVRPVERGTAREVRAVQDRLDVHLLQHVAASPVLEVESLGSPVRIELADDTGQEALVPGGHARVSVAHDATVEIPGQARVRIKLPQEALGRVAELDDLRARLAQKLAALGVDHVDEVDPLADDTERARTVLREATRDLEALLRPAGPQLLTEALTGTIPTALVTAVERAEDRVGSHLARRGEDRPLPSDEAAARAVADRGATALRAARTAKRQADETLAARRREVTALTTRLDRAEGRIHAESARLEALRAQLEESRAESPDGLLAERVEGHARSVTRAAAAVSQAARAMDAADVAGVRTALSSARHRARLAAEARDQALGQLHHLQGQVEMAAGEGRQELYGVAVADLDDAERELRAIDRRARAARHLHATLHRHRDAAHRTYVRPYTQALERLGRKVYGPDFAVTVGDDLTLAARTLDGATVPFADLSGGAKEQLGILARLAVARLVDPTQGVPVVIDDALGYSDPRRLRQMGEVLGSSTDDGTDLQVILLTCTPERYAAIPNVRTVRLTA